MKLSFSEFSKIYQHKVNEVYKFWNSNMQTEVGKHNIGWAPPCDFLNYLKLSDRRYYIAYCDIEDGDKSICDVGGFWGVFPLTLLELGYEVTMTEALKYYSKSFDVLFKYISNEGVIIVDIDPFEQQFDISKKYDFVTIMAVLEHYPHSLNFFLKNVDSIINKKGKLYIEVPNISFLITRLKFLLGTSPLVPIKNINDSATPFTGHHHEYTMPELDYLINSLEYKIQEKHFYNYSFDYNSWSFIFKRLPYSLIFNCFPNTREVISICGKK